MLRITPLMTERSIVQQTTTAQDQLAKWQSQEASGLKFQSPNQDPVAAVTAMQLSNQLNQIKLWTSTQTDAKNTLNATNNALATMVTSLNHAASLAVAGKNPGLTASDRQALIQEAKSTLNNFTSALNAQFQGVSLFAANPNALTSAVSSSTTVTNVPPAGVAPYLHHGNIGPAATIASNINGFEQGTTSVFQTALNSLNGLIKNLATGHTSASITALQQSLGQITTEQTRIGGRLQEIASQKAQATNWSTTLQTTLNNTVQVNLPHVMTQLATSSQVYQAALQSGSQILNMNLWTLLHP